MTANASQQPPTRQVRAAFDSATLIVYQAYSPQIAEAAVAAGTFVPPWKLDRMTWIKPSFRWMMYRSGWASKPGQERILAIRMTRVGFEHALAMSCLSTYDPSVHSSYDAWMQSKQTSAVRVQWDPERSLRLEQLPWRTIQVGLSGSAVPLYTSEWITGITDITDTAHEVHRLVDADDLAAAEQLLPEERPYLLPPVAARAVAASQPSRETSSRAN